MCSSPSIYKLRIYIYAGDYVAWKGGKAVDTGDYVAWNGGRAVDTGDYVAWKGGKAVDTGDYVVWKGGNAVTSACNYQGNALFIGFYISNCEIGH